MKAKKSFGQHFLINKMAVDRIVEKFGAINATGKALEVGPGMGVLTEKLLSTYPSLTAVEADHDMVAHLHNRFPLLNVVEADFLKTDLKQLMNAQEFGLVGNFPYNISSQIVFKMLDYKEYVPVMVNVSERNGRENSGRTRKQNLWCNIYPYSSILSGPTTFSPESVRLQSSTKGRFIRDYSHKKRRYRTAIQQETIYRTGQNNF